MNNELQQRLGASEIVKLKFRDRSLFQIEDHEYIHALEFDLDGYFIRLAIYLIQFVVTKDNSLRHISDCI